MGCFDLEILLNGPIVHAVYCHSKLFTRVSDCSFRLRNYFTLDQEAESNEEYLSFLDDLRRSYPGLTQPTLLVADTISFLVDLPSLHSRPILHKLFRLACLCIDEPFRELPTVKFGSIDSEDPASSLIDVILPVQSCFCNVPHAVEATTSDQSVAAFLRLEPEFGSRGLSDAYFPWPDVDFFGSKRIMDLLNSLSTEGQLQVNVVAPAATSSKSSSPVKSGKGRKKTSSLVGGAELSQFTENLLQSSSAKR